MKHYVGLDVSKLKTQVCIIDDQKKIIRETKVETHPEAIALYLYDQKLEYERIGLETGTMSTWIHAGLRRAGLAAIIIDARRAKPYLQGIVNKNDKNDARGIARLMRNDELPAVHGKSEYSQRARMLLRARSVAIVKRKDVEVSVRGMLRNMGYTMPTTVADTKYDAFVKEMIEFDADLRTILNPLLDLRREAGQQVAELERLAKRAAAEDPVCRLLMTAPGVGPVVALTFRAAVDDPQRFKNSRAVGACFGLSSRQYQSGETDVSGRISKLGDKDARKALVTAALFVTYRDNRDYPLAVWARRKTVEIGGKKARVAVARKLSVILHQMWISGVPFQYGVALNQASASEAGGRPPRTEEGDDFDRSSAV